MRKKPKTKKLGVKALLELMGCDANEAVPSGLREAEMLCKMEGPEEPQAALARCPQSGKVMFTSEHQAKGAMKRRLTKGSNVSSLRVYRCDSCSNWHFTSAFRKS